MFQDNISKKSSKSSFFTTYPSLLVFFLIIIVGFFVYKGSLRSEFIWDDHSLIENNLCIRDFRNLGKIFLNADIMQEQVIANVRHLYYRPIQIFTYAIDYFFWRLNVVGYHITNILLHCLASFLVYRLAFIIFNNRPISLSASLFFLIHPIQTQVVCYLSARGDSLILSFMLLSYIFYINYLKKEKLSTYLLMLSAYTLALFTKENSFVLPILFLLYHQIFKKRPRLKDFLPLLCVTYIYILFRLYILGYRDLYLSFANTAVERLPGFFVALPNYIRLLALPFNLHMEYGDKLFKFSNPQAIAGIVVAPLLLLYAVKKRQTNPIISFSIFFFFIALLPVSNVAYKLAFYMTESYLYIPSIGSFLLLAYFLRHIYNTGKLKTISVGLAIFLFIFYSHLTMRQNHYWQSEIEFFERTLKYAPDSIRAMENLALAYEEAGRRQEAVVLYSKAIQTDPTRAEKSYNNLANIYVGMNRKEEALALYGKAIKANPCSATLYYNLGNLYFKIDNLDYAITAYQHALLVNPYFVPAYNNLGVIYNRLGKYDEAIILFSRAVDIMPTHGLGHMNLAISYYKNKQYDLAIRHCDIAKSLGANASEQFLKLLQSHRKASDTKKEPKNLRVTNSPKS